MPMINIINGGGACTQQCGLSGVHGRPASLSLEEGLAKDEPGPVGLPYPDSIKCVLNADQSVTTDHNHTSRILPQWLTPDVFHIAISTQIIFKL